MSEPLSRDHISENTNQAPHGRMSIGDVVAQLKGEFPELTGSKIRFLEERKLISVARSVTGYRIFGQHDVEVLRWILTCQRDKYLPLNVIAGRIERGEHLADIWEQADAEDDTDALDGGGTGAVDGAVIGDGTGAAGNRGAGTDDNLATNSGIAGTGSTASGSGSVSSSGTATGAANPVAASPVAASPVAASPVAASPAQTNATGAAQPAAANSNTASVADDTSGSATSSTGTNTDTSTTNTGTSTAASGTTPDKAAKTYSIAELCAASGQTPKGIAELISYRILNPLTTPESPNDTSAIGTGNRAQFVFGEDALTMARVARELATHGLEPRHLRIMCNAAERDAAMFMQGLQPVLHASNPTADQDAQRTALRLLELSERLRSTVMRSAMSKVLN